MERLLVVSIHDVRTSTLAHVRALCAALDALGARPRVLHVVPERIADDPALIAFLHAEQDVGTELALHGYTHRAEGRLGGPLLMRARAGLFAPRDAEFLTLGADEMRSRIERGRDELAALGLHTRVFTPPAWLWTADLVPALRALGYAGLVGMAALHDLRSGRRIGTPWDGVIGADAAQERLARIPALAFAALEPRLPLFTVFLHPAPLAHPATAALLARLPRYLHGRRAATYSELLV